MLYRFPGLEKRSPEFRDALVSMCARLRVDPNHICAVIQTESGFDPHIPNVFHRHVLKREIDDCAYGLIQFLPSLLRHYGTSATEFSQRDDIWQLQYVERFYMATRDRIHSPGNAYMATFLPAFMGEPENFVLGVDDGVTAKVDADGCLVLEGPSVGVTGGDPLGYGLRLGAVYEQNSGFDLNNDGVIVISEVTATANRNYEQAKARGVFDDVRTAGTEPPDETADTEPSPGPESSQPTIPPPPLIPLVSTPESRHAAEEDWTRRQDEKVKP